MVHGWVLFPLLSLEEDCFVLDFAKFKLLRDKLESSPLRYVQCHMMHLKQVPGKKIH